MRGRSVLKVFARTEACPDLEELLDLLEKKLRDSPLPLRGELGSKISSFLVIAVLGSGVNSSVNLQARTLKNLAELNFSLEVVFYRTAEE